MPAYKAPVEDALFLLNDVFHIERFANLPGFADATPDVLAAMFGTAGTNSKSAWASPAGPHHHRLKSHLDTAGM